MQAKKSDANKKIGCKQKDRMETKKIGCKQKDRMQTKKIGCKQKTKTCHDASSNLGQLTPSLSTSTNFKL